MSTEPAQLLAIETLKAVELFAAGGASAVVEQIEATVRALESDISTPKGRGEIASLARRVSSVKVMLDDIGKEYNADLKEKAKVVDGERKLIRDRLDALRDEVRKPLDEFEAKQQARIDEHTAELAKLETGAAFDVSEPSAADIMDRINRVRSIGGNRDWEEFQKRADAARATALETLGKMLETATRREEERAELARLRAEEVKREEKQRTDQAVAAAVTYTRAEAVAETEKRIQQAAADAAEAERKRIADEQAAEDVERVKREANKRHRGKIHSAIKGALMQHAGLSEEHAKATVTAIAKGDVPHITINY